MNALALLTEAFEAGIKVTVVDGTKLALEGDALTEEMVASFKAAKPEVLRLLAAVTEVSPLPDTNSAPSNEFETTKAPVCDDCGAHAIVLLVTDYGRRYCRACLRPEPLNAIPRTKGIQ